MASSQERTTQPPPTLRERFREEQPSGVHLRAAPARPADLTLTRLREIAQRVEAGDFHGALIPAMSLVGETIVPYLAVSDREIARMSFDSDERLLMILINGQSSIEDLLASAGLNLFEGVSLLVRLAERAAIGFDV